LTDLWIWVNAIGSAVALMTLAGGFDGAVRRISTTYLARGLVDKVTQYDNATVGSGSVVDDLRYAYDDWGNVSKFTQDVDSDLDGAASGRAAFEVGHTYAKMTPSNPNGRNTIRRLSTTIPGNTKIVYSYLVSSGRLDHTASRVSRVSIGSTGGGPFNPVLPIADYEYLGLDQLVGTELLEPKVRWNHFEGATGTNPYPDLDRFNRITSSRWTGYKAGGTRDFYDVDIVYDNGSNITSVTDNVHKNASGKHNFDVLYSLDGLNRLAGAEEGTLIGGNISNRSRDERWQDAAGGLGLSQTGNWLNRRLDLNGDGLFTGVGELDETGTFDLPNELVARDIDSDSTDDYTIAYDKTGNQTDDGQHYTYVYDAFGRLRQVKNRSTGALVAEYRYNALGFRIGWHSDVTDSGGGGPDGTVDASDPWYWFCYDDSWRIVATFRAGDANPKEISSTTPRGLAGSAARRILTA